MRARFLLGPAGSGKTFRCLSEIREELMRAADGPDLLLLAPKQSTFQLERQLLADGTLRGYSRLRILSFERLAAYVFDRLGRSVPELLSEEGRVMVLRAILEAHHSNLRVFRASARLAGFARQLSTALRELQRRQLGPRALDALAAKPDVPPQLAHKLSDLALILRAYLEWVDAAGNGQVEDGACLLDAATEALRQATQPLAITGLWLDGFSEMTPQEQALLAAVLRHCSDTTLAFCLPHEPRAEEPWLSPWAVVSDTAHECVVRVGNLPGVTVDLEVLQRRSDRSRFSDVPLLAQVERVMGGNPQRAADGSSGGQTSNEPALANHTTNAPGKDNFHGVPDSLEENGDAVERVPTRNDVDGSTTSPLRLVKCANIEAEARLAAREVLAVVQGGGRFRDCAIMVRSLDGYQDVLRRVLTRYGIPFFLDRREPVSHHPLAELTRFALRTVAFDWRRDDWLGALKTGLAGLSDHEVDRLENAALSRGWEGASLWLNPLPADDEWNDNDWLEARRARVAVPFGALHHQLIQEQWKPTGAALAGAVRTLWSALRVEARLDRWSESGGPVHRTVWEQMNDWLDNLERAFREVALPLREWLQIIEAGLSGLSVGVIPPALDQVLVGSVDRSRNPDLKFALVLGMNEGVFPAPPSGLPLFSEADLEELETRGARLSPGRRQFGHERYLGYIALTRARQRMLVTWSATDAKGRVINPSRFVDELKRAFPELDDEECDGTVPWEQSRHASELSAALLALSESPGVAGVEPLRRLPAVQASLQRRQQVEVALKSERLSGQAAAVLYGSTLNLSVSALESFASCPFRFVTAHGLRVRERDEFEMDSRQTGSFQHELLAAFHGRVMDSGKPWRELNPAIAVQWVREIGEEKLGSFQHGMMKADAGREFHARALLRNLERLVETMTGWARQNEFQPEAVEVSFGMEEDGWPAWTLDLGDGRAIHLRGRVDRVDTTTLDDGATAIAILDYKSGGKRFEPLKFENGLQLQMPGYLNALCAIDGPREAFGATTFRPAGVFYVGLRAKPESRPSRDQAEAAGAQAVSAAFRHLGRFDAGLVRQFDSSGAQKGDQFQYSFNKDGSPSRRGNDALPPGEFTGFLNNTTAQVRKLGERIFAGEATVSPYQKGQETACDICEFRPICRFDAWLRPYRALKRRHPENEGEYSE